MDVVARRTPGASAPVRLGFVGCGALTRKHLRALSRIPEIEVVAAADLHEGPRRLVAERFGVGCLYADAREMLAHRGLNAVASVVPTPVKAEVAIAALDAGMHVLLEKPLAGTMEEADRIVAAARRSRGRALMGFYIGFHRMVREAERALACGRLGRLESIRTSWFSPWLNVGHHGRISHQQMRRRHGEGALTDLGSQCFHLWRRLAGAEVERLWAQAIDGDRAEEVASVQARMTNGVLATGVFSTRTTHEIEIELCGSKGRLRIGGQRFDGMEYLPLGTTPGSLAQRVGYLRALPRTVADAFRDARAGGIYMDSIRRQWLHFADVVAGRAAPACSLEDGRRALAITLAAQQSARDGVLSGPVLEGALTQAVGTPECLR